MHAVEKIGFSLDSSHTITQSQSQLQLPSLYFFNIFINHLPVYSVFFADQVVECRGCLCFFFIFHDFDPSFPFRLSLAKMCALETAQEAHALKWTCWACPWTAATSAQSLSIETL